MACVVSKLLYNLDSLWLLQADLSRLDAFHVQCLRRIYNIPCSYISRISNRDVLSTAKQRTLSSTPWQIDKRAYIEALCLCQKLMC